MLIKFLRKRGISIHNPVDFVQGGFQNLPTTWFERKVGFSVLYLLFKALVAILYKWGLRFCDCSLADFKQTKAGKLVPFLVFLIENNPKELLEQPFETFRYFFTKVRSFFLTN